MITERIARFLFSGQRIERPWEEKLSWSQKISRLGNRMRDPEWRWYGRLLLAGKVLGIGLLIGYVIQAKTASASSIP